MVTPQKEAGPLGVATGPFLLHLEPPFCLLSNVITRSRILIFKTQTPKKVIRPK